MFLGVPSHSGHVYPDRLTRRVEHTSSTDSQPYEIQFVLVRIGGKMGGVEGRHTRSVNQYIVEASGVKCLNVDRNPPVHINGGLIQVEQTLTREHSLSLPP